MQGNVDILMHHVLTVTAHFVRNLVPCARAQCHIRPEQQHLVAICPVHMPAHAVIAAQTDAFGGHIVVDDRPGRAHRFGIFGENARDHFDPVGFEHAVGVHAAQHVAGGVVQSVIARRDEPLFIILMQQTDRRVRMFFHELLDNVDGRIGGPVIHHNHFMGHHGLPGRVRQTVGDALLLVPRGNDNRYG